jgi:uncharacterized damage-inducible protein DinB
MTRSDLKDLFRHMQWADAEVWRAVLAAPAARSDQTLRSLLLHLHTVQRAFLDVWRERPLSFPDVSEFPDAAGIQAWAAPYYAAATAFLDTVDERALSGAVVMPWAAELAKQLGFPPRAPSLAETIFQVTSHSTYHRGQVNMRLRAIGGEPPLVDYIAWIWFGRPASGSPMPD